ncbi:hypothetical protein B296_00051233 [Ensete ventricosum]|uniref:Uncharacterized protein n=1 Tax=Ensete ventricosum TaxID=4639 RepID=A0A426XHF9_ENSVE|nr:hypothetical protein B296_00051233 [Ensete ventricosum]
MVGYPIGRSDSSKPTLDGQPRQHFGGSHVSSRDQVDSQSVIRGGGPGTTLPGPTPINVACHVMPSPHAAAVARPPYVSATSRETTKSPSVPAACTGKRPRWRHSRTTDPACSGAHPTRSRSRRRPLPAAGRRFLPVCLSSASPSLPSSSPSSSWSRDEGGSRRSLHSLGPPSPGDGDAERREPQVSARARKTCFGATKSVMLCKQLVGVS